MSLSWISLYPDWYVSERRLLSRHYPEFRVHEPHLQVGQLVLYGELLIHPPGGTVRRPVKLFYPQGAPYEPPTVVPLERLPDLDASGAITQPARSAMFDHRHQMPGGSLCLLQRETRATLGGDVVKGVDALKRAERWLLGVHTGHWPTDSEESELEAHFRPAGNILFSGIFYQDDLGDSGAFYFVQDFWRLHHDLDEEGAQTQIVTTLTARSGQGQIVRAMDARADLSRVYPWIRAEAWAPERVVGKEPGQPGDLGLPRGGHWWTLPREPRPFRNGRGLLEELKPLAGGGDPWPLVSSALGAELTTDQLHFLAFRYPGRHGGFEWLAVLVCHRDQQNRGPVLIKREKEKQRVFERSDVLCLRAHSVRPAALRLRNTRVVAPEIDQKSVALIGLGAIGSQVAELLAKAGVGKFRLCDSDRLATGNVARHVGALSEFGAQKTAVVRRRLLEINPYLTLDDTDLLPDSATRDLDRLAGLMEGMDLVICTTADEAVESVVNQVAILQRMPVIYGRSLRNASMGRVFLVRPGTDACKACLSELAAKGRNGQETPEGWTDVSEPEGGALLHECGRPVIPGSAVDLSFIGSLVARVGLDLLEGNGGKVNHWLWSRSGAEDVDARLAQPMSLLRGNVPPQGDCHACQEPDVLELELSREARSDILKISEASPDVETGGILIGHICSDRTAIVLKATGPGAKAERSAQGFSRDVDFVQQELERAAEELAEKGGYLGEWHSHLCVDPEPSAVDVESLFGISEAQNYATRCPVMVIAGLDTQTGKVGKLCSWAFQLGGRAYHIPNRPAG